MLILTRRVGEVITIGDNIRITVLGTIHGQVRIGIEAPAEIQVHRLEIYEKIMEEKIKLGKTIIEETGCD